MQNYKKPAALPTEIMTEKKMKQTITWITEKLTAKTKTEN